MRVPIRPAVVAALTAGLVAAGTVAVANPAAAADLATGAAANPTAAADLATGSWRTPARPPTSPPAACTHPYPS